MTFNEWKTEVNKRVESRVGLSCDDLPDVAYWDNWDDGTHPKTMALIVVEEALDSMGMPSDYLD